MILIGGAPRSGTTFAAGSLNSHPRIVTAVDDRVYECWALYYYRDRAGLVQEMRSRRLSREEVENKLKAHLFPGGILQGAAPSAKTLTCPPAPHPVPPHTGEPVPSDIELGRCSLPLERFEDDWFLCLKSPEISYVLPQLAESLPEAKFILIYRPIIEIAESMYRMALTVKKVAIFHRRWLLETDAHGQLIPPPGIPEEWFGLWRTTSDFGRCVVSAVSYLRAGIEGAAQIPPGRVLFYDHAQLRREPDRVFEKLAGFLKVEADGFKEALGGLRRTAPEIGPDLQKEYAQMAALLNLQELSNKFESLNSSFQ